MRKSVRNFEQLAEKGRKCNICGERNVLFYRLSEAEVKKWEKGGDNYLNHLKNSNKNLILTPKELSVDQAPIRYLT